MKYAFTNAGTHNANYTEEADKYLAEIGECKQIALNGQDLSDFVAELTQEDEVYLLGGDGTLNWFLNLIGDKTVTTPLFFCPCGTGNDFARDVLDSTEKKIIPITEYVQNLPFVEVNGMKRKFINGIGYGIDGYCCEVADDLRSKGVEKIDYTSIAIKGLLFHYHTTKATVTVDGKTESFKNVWLAPSMNGRYYGGGMKVTPDQKRNSGELSLCVLQGRSKIHTLMIFPSIFEGKHVTHPKNVKIMTGKEIEVKFDRPTALQIDGETVLNVLSYKVHF